MGPQPDHFDEAVLFQHLIDEAMLEVDPAGIGACQITDQFLVGRWVLKRIFLKDIQQFLDLGP